jgi:hypothetical protein
LPGSLMIWMADMIGVGATEGGLHQLQSLVPFCSGEHITQLPETSVRCWMCAKLFV